MRAEYCRSTVQQFLRSIYPAAHMVLCRRYARHRRQMSVRIHGDRCRAGRRHLHRNFARVEVIAVAFRDAFSISTHSGHFGTAYLRVIVNRHHLQTATIDHRVDHHAISKHQLDLSLNTEEMPAVESRLRTVPHRFVQQHARPTCARCHRHGARPSLVRGNDEGLTSAIRTKLLCPCIRADFVGDRREDS